MDNLEVVPPLVDSVPIEMDKLCVTLPQDAVKILALETAGVQEGHKPSPLVVVPTVNSMDCVLTAEPKIPTLLFAKPMDLTLPFQDSQDNLDKFSAELEVFAPLLSPVPETLTAHPTTTKLVTIVKLMELASAVLSHTLLPPALALMVVR